MPRKSKNTPKSTATPDKKRTRANTTPNEPPASTIPTSTLAAAGCKTEAEYIRNYRALFHGWNCCAQPSELYAQGQVMEIAVFVPDVPIPSSRGPLRALWFAHVAPGTRTGRVNTGDQFATSWDSGIRFEVMGGVNTLARAAHIHTCASATGQLTPNGDVSGLAAAEVMGWRPLDYKGDIGPGPSQYQAGGYTAGRPTNDFRVASRPIPPMPGQGQSDRPPGSP